MTLKNRLTKLEKQSNERPKGTPQVIEIHKAYEDGHTEIEVIRAGITAKIEAIERGESLPAQDPDPATEALRADILRRLDRIAEAQHEQL